MSARLIVCEEVKEGVDSWLVWLSDKWILGIDPWACPGTRQPAAEKFLGKVPLPLELFMSPPGSAEGRSPGPPSKPARVQYPVGLGYIASCPKSLQEL
jgi:hypothetical protein